MQLGTLHALSARRSLSLFLAGVVGLAGWQVWLTWRLMEQDRNLEVERSRERLEQAADLAVAELARTLGDWDLGLRETQSLPPSSNFLAKLPPGATFLLLSRRSIAAYPPKPLLFVPEPPVPAAPAPRVFDAADELELRAQDYPRALAALQPLIKDPATRLEALLRTARIERKAGRADAALETYRRLADEASANTTAASSGAPYALLAANARCRILLDLGRRDQGSAEAQSLRAALLQGRWPLSREVFEYHWSELHSLGIAGGPPPPSAVEFAALVSGLNARWQTAIRADSNAGAREPQPDSSLLLWNATAARLTALSVPRGWLDSGLKLAQNSPGVRSKAISAGVPTADGLRVARSLAEAQIPGRIEFYNSEPVRADANRRRGLWLTGVALMVLLVLASGYAVHRGLSQELRVARLQSDFVAAVSHEFRSPLTTLRTITELLAQNRLPDEARRRQSYLFLDRETNRLHRLVEDLLDFGRMESGRKQYRVEPHDAFQLVRAAVADFSDEAAAHGFHVEASFGAGPATVQADEEALRRAVRNLLENAVKYSPECRTVWVDGNVGDHRVSISVRDHGMGIDPREQRAIFQKFVRGSAGKKAGIKGAGIGLSMVRQISEALGGEIRLESKLGVGSTFTIVLPLANGERRANGQDPDRRG
ncbi:MAG TPA: HAMP domain-containing sensor histidine kinase [Bryobacteraceae bacterium]|nr:HAMP domain-containing sensor histidine kinase [Bryobacteraceae bacterium]